MQPPKLRGLHHSEKELKASADANIPLHVYLAFNDRCNLACPFCYASGGKEINKYSKKKKLTFSELESFIEQAASLGTETFTLCGEGEPMMEGKMFYDLVEKINSLGKTPVVFTNGTLLDEKAAKKLFDLNASVVGKLNGIQKETNELLTGRKGLYEYVDIAGKQVPSHIKHLIDAGFLEESRLALGTTVTVNNYSEIPEIWEWERKLGIIPYVQFLTYAGMAKIRDMDITEIKRIKLAKKVWELDKSLGYKYPLYFSHHFGSQTCESGPHCMIIGNDGQARACTCIFEFFGDIRKDSIEQISKNNKEFENKFCSSCRSNCVYCPADQYNKYCQQQ